MRLATLCSALVPLALIGPTAFSVGAQEAAGGRPGAIRPAAPAMPTLVAIRASHYRGHDRVVFEFAGGMPTRRTAAFVPRLYADGSGLPVPVAGRAVVQVTMSPAQAHTDAGAVTAPRQLAFALPNVVEVVRSGDFEGVTTYGIGVARKEPVRIHTMANPARVVIDLGAGFRTVNRPVWMLNSKNFTAGRAPYYTPVRRQVLSAAPAAGALDRIFAGPTVAEARGGLRTLFSGATGFRNLTISKGVARVQLTGGCASKGSTVTIAGQIQPTLRQFATVRWVKIFDPAGRTARPLGVGDSIPECLEP